MPLLLSAGGNGGGSSNQCGITSGILFEGQQGDNHFHVKCLRNFNVREMNKEEGGGDWECPSCCYPFRLNAMYVIDFSIESDDSDDEDFQPDCEGGCV